MTKGATNSFIRCITYKSNDSRRTGNQIRTDEHHEFLTIRCDSAKSDVYSLQATFEHPLTLASEKVLIANAGVLHPAVEAR